MYSGHDVVRISRANNEIKKNFAGMNRAVYDANRKSQFLSGVMQPLMNVIGNLGYVAVCVIGAALVMDGQITFGVITAFIMFVRLFTSPLSTLAQGMTQMQTAAAARELSDIRLPAGGRKSLSDGQPLMRFFDLVGGDIRIDGISTPI